ncbi:hypothetical protein SETIT_4G217100v2 [Setaria italica]|uniref:Ubiquitin-like protease family profile domain-containing protein n=1 Tax=Setaria italica TaxID=4555 RepID=K3Y3E6_SETIT|nr:hypothetical protein SETIT_4G217100v2 [Setaria italica]
MQLASFFHFCCYVCVFHGIITLLFFSQIFIPIRDGYHFFVYYFNMIHQRIDILDLNDYFLKCTNQLEHHESIFAKTPIIDAAFQKVSNLKLPRVHKWKRPFVDVPKQRGPNDCLFFLWKYMEYYDRESLTKEINLGTIYKCELMHYQLFHSLSQAEIPESLDKFRVGGCRVDWDSSGSQ